MEPITNVAAIKRFFEMKNTEAMVEIRALSSHERKEIADMIFKETGWPRNETAA